MLVYETCSDAGNEESMKVINDLQSKLKAANAEIISEKEKVVLIYGLFIYITFFKWLSIIPNFNLQIQTLTEENGKLQYRIIHLVRSLKEANLKLEQVSIADVSFNALIN